MAKPDPLSQGLVECSFELHRRRLWLEVPGDAPFLLKVPGVEDTLVATITGHEASSYGLFTSRGPDAFADAVRTITKGEPATDLEPQSILGFSMEQLGEIEPERRGILQAAGFQGRRESLAPRDHSAL